MAKKPCDCANCAKKRYCGADLRLYDYPYYVNKNDWQAYLEKAKNPTLILKHQAGSAE